MDAETVLTVENLKVHFPIRKGLFKRVRGYVKAVDNVSFELRRGQTLGLVGESGCGKTTIAKALVGLVPVHDGVISCDGTDLLSCTTAERKQLRRKIQMIFQDPFSSLDPRMNVGAIIGEAVKFHRPEANRQELVEKYMELSGLRKSYAPRYPHEFSGGQRQRIGIARALATEPAIVIADEPVSALDVSVQAKALNLMKDLQRRLQISFLFITHDLSVVKHISHTIAVMYLGNMVEIFPADELTSNTMHPYTRALISSIPVSLPGQKSRPLNLEGEIPSPVNAPPGCKFQTRCRYAEPLCRQEQPALEVVGKDHQVACHFWRDIDHTALRKRRSRP